MYGFLLNMWIMRKVDESFLQSQVVKGRLTQDEYDMIVSTPQLPVDGEGNIITALAPSTNQG